MKFKKVLISIGSLAIVSGLLMGCSSTPLEKEGVNDSNISEKGNEESRNDREKEGEVTIRIDAIEGNEITATMVEMKKPENIAETTPSQKPDNENDEEMIQPQVEYNITEETIKFTINDETEFKSFGKDEESESKTIEDLNVGDFISVDIDENNIATEVYFASMKQFEKTQQNDKK
ncbi:MAG: hypothetical protein ACK5L6_07150 [Anaerorhabdus sp.]|uniref:hypothetical protein n=1 Tax=Anaerorhabdus sp. TaxID=1872524 RepID=UPI003A87CAC2